MKIVALEEHYGTPEINAAWDALPPELQDPVVSNINSSEIRQKLNDFADGRLRAMDECGVDVQVLSVGPPAMQSFDPAQARDLARRSNDLLAEQIAKRPDRFQGFATLPTPDPEAAAEELRRCVTELGFKGAMPCGRTRNRPADAPEFFAIYAEAASLGVPLYIHPQVPVPEVREAYYSGFGPKFDTVFSSFGIGWHYETGVEALRMVLSGLFDRLPSLQIILGHWGELVLFYLERADGMSKAAEHLKKPVSDYFKQNFYVTPSGMFSQRYLQWTVDVLGGTDRILFSTDYPYMFAPDGGARKFLTEAPISDEDKRKIAHGNWERLTGSIGKA